MKGIVFREFLEMVESEFGYETVDQIIESSRVSGNGAYTSVGTYPHDEFLKLAEELSRNKGIAIPDMFAIFGEYIFNTFTQNYPLLIENYKDTFSLLLHINDIIHKEVLKLYPDAELPVIEIREHSADGLVLIYSSPRKMSNFAEGLIRGCLNHYHENAIIYKELLSEDQSKVLFSLTKING